MVYTYNGTLLGNEFIYTMEHYLAMRKNEILPFATTWMELDGISQSEKDRYLMFSLICGS